MAIKVGGTEVVDNNRQLKNIASVDTATVTALSNAGVGGGSSFDATADGTISDGDPLILQSDGTLKKIAQTVTESNPPTAKGYYDIYSSVSWVHSVYDTDNQIGYAFVKKSNNAFQAIKHEISATGTITWDGNSREVSGYSSSDGDAVYSPTVSRAIFVESQNSPAKIYATVGYWTGSSFSFGSPVEAVSSSYYPRIAIDTSTGKVLLVYVRSGYVRCKVGTPQNNNISFGSELQINSDNSEFTEVAYDAASGKFVVGWIRQSGSYPQAAVVTVSGTTASVGSVANIKSGTGSGLKLEYDSNEQKTVAFYRQASYHGAVKVGTISGTSISFGSEVTFGTAQYIHASFDTNLNKFLVSWRDSGDNSYFNMATMGVSGTTPSFGTHARVTQSSSSAYDVRYMGSSTYHSAKNAHVIGGSNYSVSTNATLFAITTNSATTNLTTTNYIGIADAAYTNGQTATVQTLGAIDDAQSGLAVGSKHYVQPDGTLSTSVGDPSVEAGLALSATKLLVKG